MIHEDILYFKKCGKDKIGKSIYQVKAICNITYFGVRLYKSLRVIGRMKFDVEHGQYSFYIFDGLGSIDYISMYQICKFIKEVK